MRLNGIEMIPSSLVACFVNNDEVRILELSCEGFSFRTPTKLNSIQSIQLYYLVFKESRYAQVTLNDFDTIGEEELPYYYVYMIRCNQDMYQQHTRNIMGDYSKYVRLKLTGDDAYCSQEKVNYPADLDSEFYDKFSIQKQEWLSKIDDTSWNGDWLNQLELAINVDRPYLYEQYLSMDMQSFTSGYFSENNLVNHAFAKKEVKRIYVGNEFCHHLFPTTHQLISILEKAKAEGIEVTLASTYMRDQLLEETEAFTNEIYTWCQKNAFMIEVIVNDWGMIQLLKDKKDYFQFSLGILLNKRRKDPRYQYKSGYATQTGQLAKNSLNGEEYRAYLSKQCNINRYEYEACGYRMEIPTKHNSLHLPFYQTNTSQYCTLYAKCVTNNRGKQQFVNQCPRYCEEFVFAYPKHIKMVGRYNSLFGFDDTLLKDAKELKHYVDSGINRIVLNLL